jgi:hypothetical protein
MTPDNNSLPDVDFDGYADLLGVPARLIVFIQIVERIRAARRLFLRRSR